MIQKIRSVYLFFLMLVLIAIQMNAGDKVPTFHLKNKSGQKLAIVVHAKNGAVSRQVRIKRDEDMPSSLLKNYADIIYEGAHIPEQPILVLPWHDLMYYDVHNVDSLDIYHPSSNSKNNGLTVRQASFNNVTEKTTFYLKYCNPAGGGGWFGNCPGYYLNPQLGNADKTSGSKGKRKTTEGYSLDNNITSNDIVFADIGEAGTRIKMKDGSFVDYPIIKFEDAQQNFQKLRKSTLTGQRE